MFWKFGRAGNHESFSANEGEDVKQRNFFTANKKQYTVYPFGIRQLQAYIIYVMYLV